MKRYNFICLLFSIILFCNVSSCDRNEKNQCFFTIQNNSDKEIIFLFATAHSVSQHPPCNHQGREYSAFIYDKMIKPNSSKKRGIDFVIKLMQTNPDVVLSVGIYYRIDMDTMSCEEMDQKKPIKKEWSITLSDLEACDFDLVLVYTPEE